MLRVGIACGEKQRSLQLMFVWEYPGTITELVADWKTNRTPTGMKIVQGMPPRTENTPMEFQGRMIPVQDNREQDKLMEFLHETSGDAICYQYPWSEELILLDGKSVDGKSVFPHPMSAPSAHDMPVDPRLLVCPEVGTLEDFVNGFLDGTPDAFDSETKWLLEHFEVCQDCKEAAAQLSRAHPCPPADFAWSWNPHYQFHEEICETCKSKSQTNSRM